MLAGSWHFRLIINTLRFAVGHIVWALLLMILVGVLYACLGVMAFAGVKRRV